jgi:hypothetical protein
MHRGVADFLHDIRVPSTIGVLRRFVWYPVRQKLEQTTARLTKSGFRGPVSAAAVTHQSFTGKYYLEKYFATR